MCSACVQHVVHSSKQKMANIEVKKGRHGKTNNLFFIFITLKTNGSRTIVIIQSHLLVFIFRFMLGKFIAGSFDMSNLIVEIEIAIFYRVSNANIQSK